MSKNILIGLNLSDIDKKYRLERDAPIPAGGYVDPLSQKYFGKPYLLAYRRTIKLAPAYIERDSRLEADDDPEKRQSLPA